MPFREVVVYRQGITAGVLGATAVALWFLIVDTVAGRPFMTPTILGEVLMGAFPGTLPIERGTAVIALYTLFHYGAFCIAGIVVAVVVKIAQTKPSILGGFFILFIAFELGSLGLAVLLQHATTLGSLAWYQVMAGNGVAAIAMGTYFWRTHPELREELHHSLDGLGE